MTPDEFTIKEEVVKTTDGHELYVHQWGNHNINTVYIFLHGGPGSGCSDKHKELFDPKLHQVIFFDQRGAGQSTPKGSLKNNTTQHLVDDVTLIANHFKINEFILVGGSWGSTLALAYTIKNPERVLALVLRGIFTGSQAEIDFLDKGGAKSFFPEVWQNFVNSVPKEHQQNPAKYHANQILIGSVEDAKKSAYAFANLEYSLIGLDDRRKPEDFDKFDPSGSIIEISYMANCCFMKDEYILKNANKIKQPVWIVQGRYDAICPPVNAYKLDQKLSNSKIIWTTAGHSGSDRANTDATKAILLTLANQYE